VFTAVTPGSQLPPVNRTLLDTYFSDGQAFLESASDWLRADSNAAVLHYVALCEVEDLAQWRHSAPAMVLRRSTLSAELQTACASALPGIQRLLLAGGRISLTLCAGPLQTMLSEQLFQADEVRLPLADSGPAAVARWDKWAIQLLARRCRRGTLVRLPVEQGSPDLELFAAHLSTQGFERTSKSNEAIYAPRWTLRTTRVGQTGRILEPQRCAVVGAGLAGASVAQALALRGWQVSVLDAHIEAVQGASGLPVGLVVPHVSVDDSPRSRMSRVGTRLTLQHAVRHLQRGQDWSDTGVLEFEADADRCLQASGPLIDAGWLEIGRAHVPLDAWEAGREDTASLWHRRAGWIKPAHLVKAWLDQAGIQVLHNAHVMQLQRTDGVWQLYDAAGETLAEAELVVIANATGALPLLQTLAAPWALAPDILDKLQSLQALHGTVSYGPMPIAKGSAFPPFAVNGSGSLAAHIPTESGLQWYAGATYETDVTRLQNLDFQHTANWGRLKTLLPAAANALTAQFAARPKHWSGTRCVSHDRLPLVGPAHADAKSGLWLSIAMGSRGLSFAALCAELLAARLAAEPLPIEARLAKSLDLHRTRHRRKQG
jgi:tRNA 5-methylaminomethyl-2-thiouridine biosynthesis bifunctional protein